MDQQPTYIDLLIATYSSRVNTQVRQAELQLIKLFPSQAFIQQLFYILTVPTVAEKTVYLSHEFKLAVCSLLKKFTFMLETPHEPAQIASQLFHLLTAVPLVSQYREILGVALEHLLNKDARSVFKRGLLNKVIDAFTSGEAQREGMEYYESYVLICLAYLNSLIDTEDQIAYFIQIIPYLSKYSILYLKMVEASPECIQTIGRKIFKVLEQAVNFIQIAIQRIFQYEDQFTSQTEQIRKNAALIDCLEYHAMVFKQRVSILSPSYPQTNRMKSLVMNILSTMYGSSQAPEGIFSMVYLTFLSESRTSLIEDDAEHILFRCMQMLEKHLLNRYYFTTFQQYKFDTFFSILMYMVTAEEEKAKIRDEPFKFVEMAQECTQGVVNSAHLKARAARILKAYAVVMDESVRSVMEICLVMITQLLNKSPQNDYHESIIKQFSRYQFFNLPSITKLETLLMALCVISPQLSRRMDLSKVIFSMFMIHFDDFRAIDDDLVQLRVIRAVGYFPTAVYYSFIRDAMRKGKTFLIEGIRAYEKIIRKNKYTEISVYLASIMLELIGVIEVMDPLMELIVIENHSKMLQTNIQLYDAVLLRIKTVFANTVKDSKQNAYVCFNLIYALLRKEQVAAELVKIRLTFYAMEQAVYTSNSHGAYESNLLQIYTLLIRKDCVVSEECLQFAKYQLNYFGQEEKGSKIIQFYNQLLLKMDNNVSIVLPYFKVFVDTLLNKEYETDYLLQGLPFYCFLVGQALVCFHQLHTYLTASHLLSLLSLAVKYRDRSQQGAWVQSVLLHYMYIQPQAFMRELGDKYEKALQFILEGQYADSLLRKIYIFGLTHLMEVDEKHFPFILSSLILHFEAQIVQHKIKGTRDLLPKERYMVREEKEQEQEAMEDENTNMDLFDKFKHPFQKMSEFEAFKKVIFRMASTVPEQLRQRLRCIMEAEWHSGHIRRIVTVKR